MCQVFLSFQVFVCVAVSDELYISELDCLSVVGVRFIWVPKRLWREKSLEMLLRNIFALVRLSQGKFFKKGRKNLCSSVKNQFSLGVRYSF